MLNKICFDSWYYKCNLCDSNCELGWRIRIMVQLQKVPLMFARKPKSASNECGHLQMRSTPRSELYLMPLSRLLSQIDSANIFKNLDEHMLDTPFNDNHTFSLIKTISQCYFKVCLYHLGKEATEKLDRNKVRKLNKLVLFKHQWRNFAQHF